MTPELAPAEPEYKGMSDAGRIPGVLFEPGKTFEDIARRPTYLVPMALLIATVLLMLALFAQHVGWERSIRHQFETNPRLAQMDPEQRQKAMDMQIRFSGVGSYAGVLLGIPIVDLIWAALLLGIVKGIMGAPVRFKQVFAVIAWTGIVGLISTALAIVVMFLKNPDDFNLQNPLVFNPGALMDPLTTSKFVYSLASSLDLFMIWSLVLMGIGLKAAGGKSLSTAGAMTAVFVPWVVLTLGKASLAGVFG
jgi:Yip1 domain